MYQYFHSHDPVFHGSPPSLLSVVSINSYFDVMCVMNKNPTMASKDDISDNITGARFNEDSKHYLISKFDFPEIIIISGISVDATHKISTNYRHLFPQFTANLGLDADIQHTDVLSIAKTFIIKGFFSEYVCVIK